MKVVLDSNIIQCISIFNNMTKCSVMDCVEDDGELYFVVGEGQYGLAVGKNGVTIRKAENYFKKNIRILEYSENLEKFIRNVVPEARDIETNNGEVIVKVHHADRAKVIGKGGKNVKIIKLFLERLFDVQNFKVK